VPDDFNATKRLIGGVIGATPGEPLAGALAQAQVKLMDDVNTSHPFYWAAFIILGDGAKPLVGGAANTSAPAAKVAVNTAPASASRFAMGKQPAEIRRRPILAPALWHWIFIHHR
jgi:hypothetical protein